MDAWDIAAVAAGPLGGIAAAVLSARLPGEGALSVRRVGGLALAGLAAGVWAATAMSGWAALATSLLGAALLLIAVVDAEHFWLPNVLTLPLGAAGLAVSAALGPQRLAEGLIGAAAGFAVLSVVAALYRRLRGREGLGGGDARLLAAIGAWVGWIGLPSVLVWASLAGLSWVVAKVAVRKAPRLEDQLPYGSYLALGAWLTWLHGPLGL